MKRLIYLIVLMISISCVFAATSTKSTDLFDIPKEWCARLSVTVSGTGATSENYYLEDCAESSSKNFWYCNCKTDDEFTLTFVNKKSDTTAYIIDITSGDNSVRRVVSANAFNENITEKEEESAATKYYAQVKQLTESVNSLNSKVDNYNSNVESRLNSMNTNIETKLNDVRAGDTVIQENKYDDTKIREEYKTEIEKVKQEYMISMKQFDNSITLRIASFCIIINILIIGALMLYERIKAKVNKNE